MMAESLIAQFPQLSMNNKPASLPRGGRRWKCFSDRRHGFVRKGTNSRRTGQAFTVASYNVLCQNLLAKHSDLYLGCNQAHLQLNFRRQKIIEEIDRYLPDILSLQEVHWDEFNSFFKKNLSKRGYSGVYKQRPGAANHDGCAIFYRADVFCLVDSKAIEYDRYDANCPGKYNVAILTALRLLNSGRDDDFLCVVNTHLLFNPCRGDIKTTQLMILLAEVDKMSSEYCRRSSSSSRRDYEPCPSILCGDFNLLPHSPLYRFLSEGTLHWSDGLISELSGLPASHPYHAKFQDAELKQCTFVPSQIARNCRFKGGLYDQRLKHFREGIFHHLNLKSAYPHGGRPLVTSCHSQGAFNVDYIFYTCRKEAGGRHSRPESEEREGLVLTGFLHVPTEDNCCLMPNERNGSDHVLIMAEFLYI